MVKKLPKNKHVKTSSKSLHGFSFFLFSEKKRLEISPVSVIVHHPAKNNYQNPKKNERKNVVMGNKYSMFFLGATLAFGLAISAYIIGQAAIKATKENNICVKGSSMRLVESNFAHWSGTFTVTDKNQEKGLDKLENARKTVEKYLIASGFEAKELSFGRIYSEASYEYVTDAKGKTTSKFSHYILKQSVSIASPKVHIIEKVSRESTALIKKGFEFSSNSPSYIITDLDKYKMELLEEATINATNRAKVLAKNSNGKIGALVSASQGIFQITAPASSDISSYGEYDKSTIMKEVKAVVTLAFSVE